MLGNDSLWIMSGRLVILPHKSWNVWNQDNVEKVLRDERIRDEKNAEEAHRRRRGTQQQVFEALTGTSVGHDSVLPADLPASSAHIQGEVTVVQSQKETGHVNLFSSGIGFDGKPIQKQEENQEYCKERAEADRKAQLRAGVAPWALGEGSIEKSGACPWYLKPSSQGKTPSSQVVVVDGKSKCQEDPMRDLVLHSSVITSFSEAESKGLSNSDEATSIYISRDASDRHKHARDRQQFSDDDDDDDGVHEHKKSNSRKEKKKPRHHHHDGKDRDDNGRHNRHHHHHRHRSRSRETSTGSSGGYDVDSDQLAALRRKRLERERVEHKRALLVRASHDIYGQPSHSYPLK